MLRRIECARIVSGSPRVVQHHFVPARYVLTVQLHIARPKLS
jgi:hypothetical protein